MRVGRLIWTEWDTSACATLRMVFGFMGVVRLYLAGEDSYNKMILVLESSPPNCETGVASVRTDIQIWILEPPNQPGRSCCEWVWIGVDIFDVLTTS